MVTPRSRTRAGGGALAGRRVLLTGSRGGIGTATRRALEAQGAVVVGLDLHGDDETIAVDVRDGPAVRAAVAEAAARLGGIDAVIANAGIGIAALSTDPPDERARAVMDVNFFGAWNVVAASVPHMPAGRGSVVFVASGLAVATLPYTAAYTASKRAMTGYADVLRTESQGRLTVSTVLPGYIRTAIHAEANADGASLDGVARCEQVTDAAAAIVTALQTGRRELGSSPATTAEMWFARRAPVLTDWIIRRRWRRAGDRRPRRRTPAEPAQTPDPEGVVNA